jgi:hypothetical protein
MNKCNQCLHFRSEAEIEYCEKDNTETDGAGKACPSFVDNYNDYYGLEKPSI